MSKSIAPPTLEEVDARLSQIDEELKRFDTLVQEKNDWAAYRFSLLKVTKQELPAAPVNGAKPPQSTVDYAKRVLTGKTSMHLNEMLIQARKLGWKGSGDDKTDRDRFYSAMHRQSDTFESVGQQTWKLKTP